MTEHLVIRFSERPDQVDMVVVNEDGHLLTGPDQVDMTQVADSAHDRVVTVLLPADETVSCVATIPAASPSRLRQMLPFSLEDEFATDIENLHFAPGERTEDDKLAVTVISRDRMRFWLNTLQLSGIHPRAVLSEAEAVPDTPGTVTLFIEGSRILGRRPAHAPFLFEELTLSELWQLLRTESEDAADLNRVLLFADPATLASRADEINQWRQSVDDLDIRELEQGCLPRLAAQVATRPAANLLQGEFSSRSNLPALLRPWRAAAAFVLVFLLFSLAGKAAEVWKLSQDNAGLTQQAESICAASYSTPQLNSCEGEMLRRLVSTTGNGSGNSGFLQIMSLVGTAAGDSLEILQIDYRDGVAVLEVIVPSIPYLEIFVQGIANTGTHDAIPGTTESVSTGYEVRVEIIPI